MSEIKTFELFKEKTFQNPMIDIWIPETSKIVLGRFCSEKDEIKEKAYADGVEIVRRLGGGGTVYLNSGIVVVDIAFKTSLENKLSLYFRIFNKIIINSFRKQNIFLDSENEFFDITYKDKKIAGVSIAKRKDKILYGISIIIKKNTIIKIEEYLNNPKKQPEYRKQRAHSDFLFSIEQVSEFSFEKFINDLILEYEVIKCGNLGLSG